jgi:hypothetical protein
VESVVDLVKVSMLVAAVSLDKLVPLESITFEDCGPLSN